MTYAKNDNTYNGWTNYETWRVNLEIFDGREPVDFGGNKVCPNHLKDTAEEFVDISAEDGLAKDYTMAFLGAVNWSEIADHINEIKEDLNNVS